MAVIDCKGCGAPLDVSPGAAVAVCRYCKAQNQVAAPPPSPPPPIQIYAPVPPPPVQRMEPTPVRAGTRGLGLLMFALTLGGVALAVTLAVRNGAGGLAGLLGGSSFGHWGPMGTCFVDANGDGVDDVAGLSGPPGQSTIPTLVDGATGDVIWKGADVGEGAKLECLDRQWLAVGKADFSVQIHDARKPDAPLSVRGRDQLQYAAMGKGCAALKTTDGSTLGVALPAGTPTECAASFDSPWDTPGLIGLTGESTTLTVGAREHTLTKRGSGTSILTLKVEEGGKTVLEKELPYAAATFSSGLAVAGERIVIFGARPAEQDKGLLVGLDAKTGAELYAVPLEAQVTHNIGAIAYNGRYVVLQYWSHLRAYDPATGEQVW
jgi:LSD1 subclass zinc finger protein